MKSLALSLMFVFGMAFVAPAFAQDAPAAAKTEKSEVKKCCHKDEKACCKKDAKACDKKESKDCPKKDAMVEKK